MPSRAPVAASVRPTRGANGRAPRDVLREVFGYSDFRGQQADIVEAAIRGEDVLVLMPTGAGKSMCFQVPALARDGVTIVVSPLLALIKNQVDTLRQAGVRAAELSSNVALSEIQSIEKAMRAGEIDLLYVAPERFVTDRFQSLLRQSPVSLFAIDEAHCVSQWGHDFRPDYLEVGRICSEYKSVPRIALTATADPATERDMIERLHLKGARVFRSSFDRPNISYTVAEKAEPTKQLLDFVGAHKGQSGIVYCLSRKKVEEVADMLQRKGYDAIPYHAGLDKSVRSTNQDRFIKGEGVIAVATVAFGMGIDKPDVRFVAHMDMPQSLEAYYQETGRAGRDGLASDTLLLYGLQDIVLRRQMIDEGEGDAEHKRRMHKRLQQFVGYVESADCRRAVVLRYFGETHGGGCGNCDRCRTPAETYDGTADAILVLGAARGSRERFGAGHLVDIVSGNATDKVRANRHQHLDAFGKGAEKSKHHWQAVIRQLVALGLMNSIPDRNGGMALTEDGIDVLNGGSNVNLVKPRPRVRSASRSASPAAAEIPAEQQDLWNDLRKLRSELAREQGMPPYIIFQDTTLLGMMQAMPKDLHEMSKIPGVGTSKLDRYGEQFLEIITRHNPEAARGMRM